MKLFTKQKTVKTVINKMFFFKANVFNFMFIYETIYPEEERKEMKQEGFLCEPFFIYFILCHPLFQQEFTYFLYLFRFFFIFYFNRGRGNDRFTLHKNLILAFLLRLITLFIYYYEKMGEKDSNTVSFFHCFLLLSFYRSYDQFSIHFSS